MSLLRRSTALFDRVLRIFLIFAVARIAAGIVTIAFFDRDAVAWGIELTMIIGVAVAVYVIVALCVRRWAPSRAN